MLTGHVQSQLNMRRQVYIFKHISCALPYFKLIFRSGPLCLYHIHVVPVRGHIFVGEGGGAQLFRQRSSSPSSSSMLTLQHMEWTKVVGKNKSFGEERISSRNK
jgi:hypothetical protein